MDVIDELCAQIEQYGKTGDLDPTVFGWPCAVRAHANFADHPLTSAIAVTVHLVAGADAPQADGLETAARGRGLRAHVAPTGTMMILSSLKRLNYNGWVTAVLALLTDAGVPATDIESLILQRMRTPPAGQAPTVWIT